jgi:hypothetical protein
MNNGFKQFREITENGNRSVVGHSGMIASFKYRYNSSFFPSTRKILLGQVQVKYMPKNRNKIIIIIFDIISIRGNTNLTR